MDNTFGGAVVWNFPIDVAFKVGFRTIAAARMSAQANALIRATTLGHECIRMASDHVYGLWDRL